MRVNDFFRTVVLASAFVASVACGGKAKEEAPPDAGTPPLEAGAGGQGGSGGSVASAGVGAAGSGAGAPSNAGICQPFCESTADCCTDCTYPQHFECSERHCKDLGCTSDAECVQAGAGDTCRPVHGVPRCVTPCSAASDCTDDAPLCAGRDDDGASFCGERPVLLTPCFSDKDCSPEHGQNGGVCDTTTHRCGCALDEQCPSGSVCTW